MGLIKSCLSRTQTSANAPAPNPNPGRFKILTAEQVGNHVVAMIKYLDCTNFEGVKICVYKNVTCSDILVAKLLDPHFSMTGLSPFARFTPTADGLFAAHKLAQSL